jgi:hypothetical protein
MYRQCALFADDHPAGCFPGEGYRRAEDRHPGKTGAQPSLLRISRPKKAIQSGA